MPSIAVLDDLGDGRTLVEIVGGAHDGDRVVVTHHHRGPGIRPLTWYLDGDEVSAPIQHALRSPADKANELLESLLSVTQLKEWRSNQHFWVPTPYGSVELGTLFNLRFKSISGNAEFVLCVVPEVEDASVFPEADIWTNLLLMLRHDPDQFFRVANWRYAHDHRWWRGRVPVPI